VLAGQKMRGGGEVKVHGSKYTSPVRGCVVVIDDSHPAKDSDIVFFVFELSHPFGNINSCLNWVLSGFFGNLNPKFKKFA